MIDISLFTVFDYPECCKTRIGTPNDGGYIIIDNIGKYDILLSGGISNNCLFEKEFTEKFLVPGLLFDHTINKLSHQNELLTLYRERLNNQNNLELYLDKYQDVLIKMDIEGSEYEVVDSWKDSTLRKIKQFVIEFHNPYEQHKLKTLQKLLKYHTILHIHGNNCCGFKKINNTNMPKILEITAVRKDILSRYNINLNQNFLPSNIDQPNVSSKEDLILNYPPFCH